MNKKGFTLIEAIIVIAILGVIGAWQMILLCILMVI